MAHAVRRGSRGRGVGSRDRGERDRVRQSMSSAPGMSSADRAALHAFWRFYEPRRSSIGARLPSVAVPLPDPALLRAAVLGDEWGPYLAALRRLAEGYADAEIDYAAWLGVVRAFREEVQRELDRIGAAEALRISQGLHRLVELVI